LYPRVKKRNLLALHGKVEAEYPRWEE